MVAVPSAFFEGQTKKKLPCQGCNGSGRTNMSVTGTGDGGMLVRIQE